MLILLPPSEGKASPRRGRELALPELSLPGLTEAREQVLDNLVALCRSDRDAALRALGLGPTQTAELDRNTTLRSAPTARADAIYTGVLYDALALPTLAPEARRRAARWLAITSSVFGLLRPGDRIPAYRLSGDVNLPGVGAIAAHWRAVLDPMVRELAGPGLLVDLRSTTYAGFWRPDRGLDSRVATVRVLQQVGSQRKAVSHFNKATKGRLVRALLESGEQPRTPTDLSDHVVGLGWKVEVENLPRGGTRLDVVVEDL